MKLLIGLGNPGEKYKNNRHNIGHMMIDYIGQVQSSKFKIQNDNSKFKILKTDCFMNLSGSFVKKALSTSHLTPNNLVIIHDDLDIPLGKFKIQRRAGPQLHNGINSIEKALGTKDFWRVRIGVDTRTPDNWIDGEAYVLQNFRPKEKPLLIEEVFPKILKRLETTFHNNF